VTSNKAPSPEQPAAVSPERYKLLISMLKTYAFALVALATAPTLFPVRQPPAWVTISELTIAILFIALAFFIAPKAHG